MSQKKNNDNSKVDSNIKQTTEFENNSSNTGLNSLQILFGIPLTILTIVITVYFFYAGYKNNKQNAEQIIPAVQENADTILSRIQKGDEYITDTTRQNDDSLITHR